MKKTDNIRDFKEILYEAVLVAYGKNFVTYNAYARDIAICEIGENILNYLYQHGYKFEELGNEEDIERVKDFFVANGFAKSVHPSENEDETVWHELFGANAYAELIEFTDTPFLSCPLNAVISYIARKYQKGVDFISYTYSPEDKIAVSRERIIDHTFGKDEYYNEYTLNYARLIKVAQNSIDELSQVNKELEKQKELYNLVLKNSSSSVLILDIATNTYIDCNDQAVMLLKYNLQDDILNLHPSDLSPEFQPDGRRSDEKSQEMNTVALKNGSHSFEWKHIDATEREFWVEVILTTISIDNKKVIHVVWNDINSRKIQEAILKESERVNKALKERMELALLGNHDGVWDWNLNDNSVYFSPRWKEMLGYSDDELSNSFENWENNVHEDDLVDLMIDIRKNIDGKTEYLNNIHRMKHKDGHWVWIQDRGKTLFDDEGKATRMIGTHTDITEAKELQLELTHRGQIIDQIHDSVITTNMHGYISSWNMGAERLFGYTHEEILGKHITTLDLKGDVKTYKKIIDNLIQNGEYHAEFYVTKKSKQLIYVSLALSLLKDEAGLPMGMVAYSQDMTQHKNAEDKLNEQHQYLQTIIDSINDPLMVINEDYSVALMNMRIKKNIDKKFIADAEHPKCYEIFHHRMSPCDGIDNVCPLTKVLETKKVTKVVHHNRSSNGQKRSMELIATPLFNNDNKCIGIIELGRDITEYLSVQDKLREQKKSLDETVNEQVRALREKDKILIEQSKFAQMGEMINMIAHQWRQPLNAISAAAIKLSMLSEMDELDLTRVGQSSDFIQGEVQSLSNIINDFMNFNKTLVDAEIQLDEAINQSLKIIKPQLKSRSITIETDIDKSIKVFHNQKSIDHALLNLLVNARDAFDDHPEIEDKRVKIYTKEFNDSVELIVEDNAGGIPKDIVDKIFNPYFTTKEQGKGTGIGLYIVKEMLEQVNGGSISVKVIDGHTLFTMHFRKGCNK